MKLPEYYSKFLSIFDYLEAEKLLPLSGPGTNYTIKLEKVNRKELIVPQGPLYNISRDELIVLRKTLIGLLNKQFIRVSNSLVVALVLFIQKLGSSLQFYIDYQALNWILRKDRYPLPLIHETLYIISKAKQFIKLNIIIAFYKIRIIERDEQKIAFYTRYRLYKQLVTLFRLANTLSTFQKYINQILRDYLNEFYLVYVNNVLVYSKGTLAKYKEYIQKVLRQL